MNNNINNPDNKTISVIQSFDNTFESDNLVDSFSRVLEMGFDKALEFADIAPILNDIPVLGMIVDGTKTIANLHLYKLAKKVFDFFYGIKDIPIEKRQKFAREYCQANREDTAEALLGILDRLNNQNYVPIICSLMRAKMDEKITIPEFNRTVLALERTTYTDLQFLTKFIDNYYEEGLAEAFESAGLVYQSVIDGGDADPNSDNGIKLRLSPTGRILLVYGLGYLMDVYAPRNTDVKSGLKWETF